MFIRATVERVLKRGADESITGKILLSPLFLFSILYGVLVRIKVFLYKRALLSSYRLPCKVVSIGNITVGGTGKTPMTLYLGKAMAAMGYRVAVLSRGYGGSSDGKAAILSNGAGPLYGPEVSGDEPYLIASKLKDVPVIIGKDRYSSGMLAWENFGIDVIILDDGFQYLRLKRDVNILLMTPHTFKGKGYLLPRGSLREPLNAAERADLIMIKREGEDGCLPLEIKGSLKTLSEGKLMASFKYRPVSLIDIKKGKRKGVEFIKDKTVLGVCGVADPHSFLNTLKGLGASVTKRLVYPDHYTFTTKDIRKIEEVSNGVDGIVTTEKDGVRLRGLIPEGLTMYALEIDVAVSEEERFKDYLQTKLIEN